MVTQCRALCVRVGCEQTTFAATTPRAVEAIRWTGKERQKTKHDPGREPNDTNNPTNGQNEVLPSAIAHLLYPRHYVVSHTYRTACAVETKISILAVS